MDALRNGDSLVIFPEGTRSHKGCLRWKNLSSNLDKIWYFSNNVLYAGHYSAAR